MTVSKDQKQDREIWFEKALDRIGQYLSERPYHLKNIIEILTEDVAFYVADDEPPTDIIKWLNSTFIEYGRYIKTWEDPGYLWSDEPVTIKEVYEVSYVDLHLAFYGREDVVRLHHNMRDFDKVISVLFTLLTPDIEIRFFDLLPKTCSAYFIALSPNEWQRVADKFGKQKVDEYFTPVTADSKLIEERIMTMRRRFQAD